MKKEKGSTLGGIDDDVKREFDIEKLTFKPPNEEATTANEFLRHLLELYKKSKKK
jgi:hypothetical protein